MATLLCDDALHASRAGQPGHRASLGTGPQATGHGMLCEACRAGRDSSATETAGDTRNYFAIRQGGDYIFARVRVYNGEVIGERQFRQSLAAAVAAGAITSAQRTTFLGILASLRDFAVNTPG